MKKVFLFGWFGENNIGDDALLKQILLIINKINFHTEVTVFSNNSNNLLGENYNCNVKFANKSKNSLLRALNKYDIYIFGPGGLFPNRDIKKMLFLYLYILILKIKHKKVLFLGLGIENCNFKGRLNKFIINSIIKKVDGCTLRYDFNRYDEQKKLKGKCIVSSDVMFLKEYQKTTNKPEKKYIVVALANIFDKYEQQENFINSLRPLFFKMIDDGFELHFLTFTDKKDYELNSFVIRSLGEKSKKCKNISFTKNIDAIINEFSGSNLVIGMRFHSLVFASNLTIPFISLSYSSKNEELLADLKLEKLSIRICVSTDKYFCKIINLDSNKIIETYEYLLNNYDDIKEKIKVNVISEKEKSQNHIEMLKKYIGE